MLRHTGVKRTPQHNLRLAVLLGLTAGFVNAAGFLGFGVLTTNVTGHAALFAENIAIQNWETVFAVAVWMLLFLAGAFFSSLVISLNNRNQRLSYLIPILVEIVILLCSAVYGYKYDGFLFSKDFFAGSLLFAMGLQNSLVSMISGSIVRTTHLTGTFTDLGIELAQLFNRQKRDIAVLKAKIKLKLFIIFSFMTGAVSGAYFFISIGFPSFYIPVVVLFFALLYDIFRIKAKRYYHITSNAVKRSIRR